MRRNFMKPAIIALAGLLGMGTGAAMLARSTQAAEIVPHKSQDVKIRTRHKVVKEVGGLPLASMGNPGMTPKEYGQLVASGGTKKHNRLRYSHNAKLKRRMSA